MPLAGSGRFQRIVLLIPSARWCGRPEDVIEAKREIHKTSHRLWRDMASAVALITEIDGNVYMKDI